MGLLDIFKFQQTRTLFLIIGALAFISGFIMWFIAAFRIDKYIKSNELYTGGIYSWVRNPCYSGIMSMCTGAIFITNNTILLILPILYWIFMTVLMKSTVEKWLKDLYGNLYIEYCKEVNRCIPFPRKYKKMYETKDLPSTETINGRIRLRNIKKIL